MGPTLSFLTRRLATSGQRVDPDLTADGDPLARCCEHLADRATAPDQPAGTEAAGTEAARTEATGTEATGTEAARTDPALLEALVAVGTEYGRLQDDPSTAAALLDGARPWPEVAPVLLDRLLAAAAAALATDPGLTVTIADTVLDARRGSRAAWRLRAQAHEQSGDLAPAIEGHAQYLARTEHDRLGVGVRLERLQALHGARLALVSAIDEASDQERPLPAAALAVRSLLAGPVRQEELDRQLAGLVRSLTGLRVAELGPWRDLLQAAIACLRTSGLQPPPLPRDTAPALAVLRLGDLRSWLAGRSICLIGDGADRADGGGSPADDANRRDDGAGLLGEDAEGGDAARLDRPGRWEADYDLVARFGSARPGPSTGGRTDLMVVRHDRAAGWDQPADLRLVLADDARDWEEAVRRHLVAGAQRGLLDKSLRRPAHQNRFVGTDRTPGRATSAFHLIRLLDHLDVNPVIDLIGFRRDAFSEAERAWLRRRVRRVDAARIGLR